MPANCGREVGQELQVGAEHHAGIGEDAGRGGGRGQGESPGNKGGVAAHRRIVPRREVRLRSRGSNSLTPSKSRTYN